MLDRAEGVHSIAHCRIDNADRATFDPSTAIKTNKRLLGFRVLHDTELIRDHILLIVEWNTGHR